MTTAKARQAFAGCGSKFIKVSCGAQPGSGFYHKNAVGNGKGGAKRVNSFAGVGALVCNLNVVASKDTHAVGRGGGALVGYVAPV